MDVLTPHIIRIGNKCYRKNQIDPKYIADNDRRSDGLVSHPGYVPREDVCCDEVCDAFVNIEETQNGFQLKLEVPSALFKFLIGKKGETKKRLENETSTQIRVPKQGQEGPVVIVGRDKKGVLSVKNRIDILVASGRDKHPFTHFLSFPVTSEEIKERFLEFKDDVTRFCNSYRGIDPSLFQGANKLHLTVGTLTLLSDQEVRVATELLEECKESIVNPILKGTPVHTRVRGLEYMNDDPNSVDVLYASVHMQDGSDKLQLLSDRLVDKFSSAGLMLREHDKVKLHITVMNSRFRADLGDVTSEVGQGRGQARSRGTERVSFDASSVLRLYGDFDFGACSLDFVHLSIRHSSGPDGYYKPAAILKLRRHQGPF